MSVTREYLDKIIAEEIVPFDIYTTKVQPLQPLKSSTGGINTWYDQDGYASDFIGKDIDPIVHGRVNRAGVHITV